MRGVDLGLLGFLRRLFGAGLGRPRGPGHRRRRANDGVAHEERTTVDVGRDGGFRRLRQEQSVIVG
jgi:hypothetical protein